MKLKKYNEYVKEDLTPMSVESEPLEVENDMTGEIEGERRVGQDDEFMDYDGDDASTLIGNNMNDEQEEEEEGHEYEGTKLMSDLAQKLGTEIVNNSIEYNGKKINFFSETESFHIDKKKFKTIDEVLAYLGEN
jgi:hypothetical protein